MKLVDQARRLLALADRDIKAFHVLKEAPEISLVTVCFHAQQAVEKSLKAILILHGIEFRRTHDLYELAHLLIDNAHNTPFTPEELGKLTPYAMALRYEEEEIQTVTRNEAEIIMETVRRWAGEKLEKAQRK